MRPISSRGKGRPVGSSSPRTTARSALQESSKTTHSARTHCHDSPQASSTFGWTNNILGATTYPTFNFVTFTATNRELFQASPRTVPRQGERQAAYVEPRWVKELGGPSSTETGMLWPSQLTSCLHYKHFWGNEFSKSPSSRVACASQCDIFIMLTRL